MADELELLAASLRADAGEIGTFVEALAVKLEEAIPGGVRVYRWRQRMFGPKLVNKITVDAGERRLELKRTGPTIEASYSRLSGGIVLKTEPLDIDAWLTALREALTAEARRSDTTRQALARLLDQSI